MIHRLRAADSSDFSWLWPLHRQCHRGFVEASGAAWDEAEQRADFTQCFARHDVQVIEVGDETVGALAVDWDAEPAQVVLLDLEPAWQGRGLGTRLVHDVVLLARQREAQVRVRIPDNSPADALFRRLGFKTVEGEDSGRRMQWAVSVRTDVTLAAAMAPWADEGRRRAWAQRLFEREATQALAFVEFAAGRAGLAQGPARLQVLDCHAGSGGQLRGLVALGWHATGACPDDALRTLARRRTAVLGEHAAIDGFTPEARPEQDVFDVVLALDGVLWNYPTHAERVAALVQLRRAARVDALLVVEGPNCLARLHAAADPTPRTEVYHRARVSLIPQSHYDFHRGLVEHRDTIAVEVEGEEVEAWTERRRHALLGRPELLLALEQAGWERVETFRDLRSTNPSHATGPQLVLSARAPADPSW